MDKQYHIALSAKMIDHAQYAIVPGDPGRVADIAQAIDPQACELAFHREYRSFLAYLHDTPILVCSTGIGGPAVAIAMEELAQIGVRYFLRAGTTGSIQEHIRVGDFIITKAAVRLDGASRHYAPIEYPAVASLRLSASLYQAMDVLGIENYHVGITASSDTFYPGQERYDSYTHYVPRALQGSLKEWRQLNVLNYEMESATLFTLANTFGLHAACFCQVIANRINSEAVDQRAYRDSSDLRNNIIRRTLENEFIRQGWL